MNKKSIEFINLVLVVAILAVAVYAMKPFFRIPGKVEVKKVSAKVQVPAAPEKDSVIYEIDKIKGKDTDIGAGKVTDIRSIYANHSKEDVGGDILEAWARVDPADKAKLSSGLDAKISEAREQIKLDPNNKKAKALLAVSESLKRLTDKGFNYASRK